MNATKFQAKVQDAVKAGKSVLVIAPTGLGKTFAVTGDLQERRAKTVYAVPLRALGGGIRAAIGELNREGVPIRAVVHHGDVQESTLFSEEVIVTTYDQVVCGVPGLPLSLPLKAGHAVAGALLMSRLVLDEVHLAWSISDQALAILLGIIEFRRRYGLQTVLMTATLPDAAADVLSRELGLELAPDLLAGDEGVELRNTNRKVKISSLSLKRRSATGAREEIDFSPLDAILTDAPGKRIYFANTVDRLQRAYDRLTSHGVNPERVTVLHNRMPRSWRLEAEKVAHERFGKGSPEGDWLLLTNQVAEAGLDISAARVVSDPAPVDTLLQRAGRCARWFRRGPTTGEFVVIKVPGAQLKEWSLPYGDQYVGATLREMPDGDELNWGVERSWINRAWGIRAKQKSDGQKAQELQRKQIETALAQTIFSLNLFDRAAQQRRPGEIANAFREIVSVEVAVYDAESEEDLDGMVRGNLWPETSSVRLGRAWMLLRNPAGAARALRYDEEGELKLELARYVHPGDTLLISSTAGYLHRAKGLCFGDGSKQKDVEGICLRSDWRINAVTSRALARHPGRRQTLLKHVVKVMGGTRRRLARQGAYRRALVSVLRTLEPDKHAEKLADVVAQIATVGAALHDIGKSDRKWQARARELDPGCPDGLIGRTATLGRIGVPHTPPGYMAILRACELLIGSLGSSEHLVQAIALAAVRHHSSLLNPSAVQYEFDPGPETLEFVGAVLRLVGAPASATERASEILDAAQKPPPHDLVPLLLPNDDLFPIYALVGRAILMADREDAAGHRLEEWEELR